MERDGFKILLSEIVLPADISADEMQQRLVPMNKALLQMMPPRLYRYRSASDSWSIEALKNDQLWMVTADKFNDPYDTLICYNSKQLHDAVELVTKPDIYCAMLDYICKGGTFSPELQSMIGEEDMKTIREQAKKAMSQEIDELKMQEGNNYLHLLVDLLLPTIQLQIQHQATIACFSESPDSILMWSHYADFHKGFVLGYDMRPMLLPNKDNLGIFPVVYDDARYDATSMLLYWLAMFWKIPVKDPDQMSQLKQLLYKSKDWDYEKEWRLLDFSNLHPRNNNASFVSYKPNSIYYGARMDYDNQQELRQIAQAQGLEEYKVYVDNASKEYRMTIERLDK